MVWGEKSMIFCKLNPTVLTIYQEENWKEINSKEFQQKSIFIQAWQICFVLVLQSNVMHQPEIPITTSETGYSQRRLIHYPPDLPSHLLLSLGNAQRPTHLSGLACQTCCCLSRGQTQSRIHKLWRITSCMEMDCWSTAAPTGPCKDSSKIILLVT